MELNGQLHAPVALVRKEDVPLDKGLGRPQSWFGHCEIQENSNPFLELNHSHPGRILSVYRLSYPAPSPLYISGPTRKNILDGKQN
jgi:hypothetical protein